MIEFRKYKLDDDDIAFFLRIKDYCINGQSELVLEHEGETFSLEPHGEEVVVVNSTGTIGEYSNFGELFLNHKINGKPLIELIKYLEFGEF